MQKDLFGYQPASDGWKAELFKSDEWKQLRYQVIQMYGAKCQCCGQRPKIGNPLQVDHIQPVSRAPHLALDFDNLQVLCRDCNIGKSNLDDTDWRDDADRWEKPTFH